MKRIIVLLFPVILITFLGCISNKQKSINNIKLGIKNETTASAKYVAYAQEAWNEGLDTIARLFEAASKSESYHASNHKAVLKTFKVEMDEYTPAYTVGKTLDNLKDAIKCETSEVDSMYPAFIFGAKKRMKSPETVKSLTYALETEKRHIVLFKNALKSLEEKTPLAIPYFYAVCPVCGCTYDSIKAPENCEVCTGSKDLFIYTK
jgi:rubrerythrin